MNEPGAGLDKAVTCRGIASVTSTGCGYTPGRKRADTTVPTAVEPFYPGYRS